MPTLLSVPLRSLMLSALLCHTLAACGDTKDQDNGVAGLDASLTTNIVDPALREALAIPLASDPDLAGEANRDAVRPSDRPLNGALPSLTVPAQIKAEALRIAGGRLVSTPPVSRTIASTGDTPATLVGLARQGAGKLRCTFDNATYTAAWAQRLPAAFPLYPGAQLREAAGTDENASCILRAVSFVTGARRSEVMDFYTTMAKRGGYSIEHIEQNGADALIGATGKGNAAYHIRFGDEPGGGTAVDLIVRGHATGS